MTRFCIGMGPSFFRKEKPNHGQETVTNTAVHVTAVNGSIIRLAVELVVVDATFFTSEVPPTHSFPVHISFRYMPRLEIRRLQKTNDNWSIRYSTAVPLCMRVVTSTWVFSQPTLLGRGRFFSTFRNLRTPPGRASSTNPRGNKGPKTAIPVRTYTPSTSGNGVTRNYQVAAYFCTNIIIVPAALIRSGHEIR